MKKISALAVAGVFAASLAGTAFAEGTDLKISGEIRVRHVELNNADFNSDAGDASNTTSQRTRVNVDAKVNETTKAYVSLQDTRNWGGERNTTDTGANLTTTTTTTTTTNCNGPDGTVNTGDDTCTSTSTSTSTTSGESVDVSQAYIQFDKLAGQPLSAKLGRQILTYGDQRLIGGLEWTDNARRFDAFKFVYSQEAVNVDFFLANVKENAAASPADAQFNGLYATLKTIPMHKALDLYLLQKKNDSTTLGQNILTYGIRLDGGVAGIDWTAEYAMQGGDHAASVTKEASMLAVKAGYTLADVMGLRIGAEYDSGTGDKTSSTTKNETFDQLYPTAHPLYGVMDLTGGTGVNNSISNLNAISLNVSVKPAQGLRVAAEYWDFKKTEAAKKGLGTEMNIQAWYAVSSNVDLHGFVARYTPNSDALAAGAKTDPSDNVTLQMAVKF